MKSDLQEPRQGRASFRDSRKSSPLVGLLQVHFDPRFVAARMW